MKRMRAPTSRTCSTASAWRSRSSMMIVTSPGSEPLASATRRITSGSGSVRLRQSAILGAAGDLLHVDARARVEHRALLRERDHRQCRGHPARREARALERVDGDVDLGRAAVADPLAVVEHRRLVLLALADDDGAVHRDGVEEQPHRVDGGLVGRLLVAAPDPARGGERRGLGHAHELEREVAVGLVARAHVVGDDSRPGVVGRQGRTSADGSGCLALYGALLLGRSEEARRGDHRRRDQRHPVAPRRG